jgi:hypothetical protein
MTNFTVVEQIQSQRSVGLWNADAFVKKNSGRGFKRAPHLIFDRGVNRGLMAGFKLLTDPSNRKPEWSKGIIGTGSDAKPRNGIRLFLQPLDKAEPHHALRFKNTGTGKHHLQPIALVVPIIMQMYGPSCGISPGADYSTTYLRTLVAYYGPEVCMPNDTTPPRSLRAMEHSSSRD